MRRLQSHLSLLCPSLRVLPHRTFARVVLLFCVSFLASCSLLAPSINNTLVELRAGQYRMDPQHTAVLFKIQHLGLSTYVGRFNRSRASLDFDPTQMAHARLDAVVDMASIDVNNPDLAESLRSGSWLGTTQFPEAHFTTLSVRPLTDNTFAFTGNLNWHGIIRPVTLTATFHGGTTNLLSGHYTLGFSATGVIKRSEFGVDSYIPLVGDDVQLEIFAEFLRE